MHLENKHVTETCDGLTRGDVHCTGLHVACILNEGKASEGLEISFPGCSHVSASEAEEDEIEAFSGNLHEEHHEPHHHDKFDAATMLLFISNLLED